MNGKFSWCGRTARLALFLFAAAAAAALTGCARRTLVSEVLQQPQDARIYTRYNIWYTDAADISCLNILQGRFLPVGSEVVPVRADEHSLVFRDADGGQYNIRFRYGERMCSMRQFIRQIFTLESREKQLADIRPAAREKILKGEVTPGMTREEIIFAYGPPPPVRTPDLKNMTWIYYTAPDRVTRLNFRSGKLFDILNLD